MKTLSKFVLMVVALIGLSNTASFATDYYVDPSSTATTANGTLAFPWKTIAQVNSGTTLLNPGDNVFFKRGQSFSGRLTISRSGSASAPIVYSNYGTGNLPEFNNAITDIINITNKQYIVIDGIKIIDNSISTTDHTVQAKISYAINIENSPNCTIRNCDISLVGVGISVLAGSDNTTITGNYMHNMRMVRNTPTSVNPDDDYGANPMVIGSSNNNISNNRFEECWALSYDYGYDGGAVELFGATMNNNKIMYNTAVNCNGFMEIGSSSGGTAQNNIVAYNKIINCGIIGVYQNGATFSVTVNNLQYYNNTVVETVKQYSQPGVMFWMAGTGTAGMVVVKNNIFWLSSGNNLASSKFNTGQMVHTNNIYRMASGSLGITLNSSELLSTNASLFTSVAGAPTDWNYVLPATSAAVNFGTNVGLLKDYAGNAISGNPDAGMLELTSAPPVIVPVTPLDALASAGTISCNGGTTTVVVSATGGTSPYTGIGSFSVAAGTFKYFVTDAKGLKDSVSVVVAQPTAIAASLTSGTITTAGGSTSITASASGGTSPYNYNINNGAYQTSNVFSGVLAGTNTVNVKDNKGCLVGKSITIAAYVPPVITPLDAIASAGTINCNGVTTTISVSATGGTAPYTGIGNFTVHAGSYKYFVTDVNGLKDSVSINVTEPTAILSTLTSGNITTSGGTTMITVNASGGTSPYSFNIGTGIYQTSNVIANVLAGTYTVNVQDSKGCLVGKSITIAAYVPPVVIPLDALAAAGSINCNGGTTIVVVSATGGTSPYTGTGSFTVAAGNYKYFVTDSKGLKDSVTIAVAQPTAIAASLTSGAITSSGGSTSITVNASGGTSPYTYNINNGLYQSSNMFSGVLAGTYTVNTKDSKGCIAGKSITIAAYQDPVVTTYVKFRVSVYPNPTTNYFKVSFYHFHSSYPVYINVFNTSGNLMYSVKGDSYTTYSFGNSFISGTYIVKVTVGGTTKRFKVLKL
jgi:parallel beta-helix repeat protein